MFRNLNQVPMCSESEYIAKSILSAPFGGHLGFMQIRWSSRPWIKLNFLYVMWGTYLNQMMKKKILWTNSWESYAINIPYVGFWL